jgi:hypothetical protein
VIWVIGQAPALQVQDVLVYRDSTVAIGCLQLAIGAGTHKKNRIFVWLSLFVHYMINERMSVVFCKDKNPVLKSGSN